MYNYKRLPISFWGPKALKAAAISSLFMFSSAYATGLGKLTVLSSLGQPLRAEIELTSPNKDELNSLVPKIASLEAFRQANIEFNPALLSLRFAIEPRGTGYIVRVTSSQAMNEPYIDFLLEMNASNGRLVREYTALLDPAELSNSQAAQITNPSTPNIVVRSQVTPTPVPTSAPTPALQGNSKPREIPTNVKNREAQKTKASKVPEVHGANADEKQYQVKSGDTLMRIAANHANGVSLDQMLVSIYRANPQAFVGDNMNRLKAGQVLTIPDADTSRASSVGDAHAVVLAHSLDFNAYRQKLAGQILLAPVDKPQTGKHAISGSITTKVKETATASNESLDKLKLSKATGNAKGSNVKTQTEEDKIARARADAETSARVKELEKNVSELNRLLALSTKNAQAQAAASAKASAKVEPPAKVEVPKPTVIPVPTPVPTPVPAVASASASHPASASQVASASKEASANKEASVASAKEVASAPAAKVEQASAQVKPKKIAPPPPAPAAEESSWFDAKYLLGAGLFTLIAGGIFVYSSRRKKNVHQFEDSILTGSSLKANSMFGSTGGQSVDTNNSVFNSNFAPSASQLDANEVDPVAEADVYIAYGRDTQAEEILKEALKTQPDRHAVRLKLMEIYFDRKDVRNFEVYAGELFGMTGGEGDEWAQAASMGVSLDPSNPMYAGASAPTDMHMGAGLGLPTQPLEDLEADELLESSLSQDMLESISIIDTASASSEDVAQNKTKERDDSDDLGGLDFDLDIADIEASAAAEVVPTLPVAEPPKASKMAEEAAPVIDFGSIDFDLGGDAASEEIIAAEVVEESTPELPILAQIAAPAAPAASLDSSHEIEFDLGGMDFDVDAQAGGVATAVAPSAKTVDVGLGVELTSELEALSGEVETQSYNAEMATKLDLAVAYQEIGDKEGARELLEEVMRGGSSDQIEKAKGMLAKLS